MGWSKLRYIGELRDSGGVKLLSGGGGEGLMEDCEVFSDFNLFSTCLREEKK